MRQAQKITFHKNPLLIDYFTDINYTILNINFIISSMYNYQQYVHAQQIRNELKKMKTC